MIGTVEIRADHGNLRNKNSMSNKWRESKDDRCTIDSYSITLLKQTRNIAKIETTVYGLSNVQCECSQRTLFKKERLLLPTQKKEYLSGVEAEHC